jgi:hypothetical protein
MKKKSLFACACFFILQGILSFNLNLYADVVFVGSDSISIRFPNAKEFVEHKGKLDLEEGILFKGKPNFENQIVASSTISLASHSISLFPGSLLKFSKGKFVPLIGRFQMLGKKHADNLVIQTGKFILELKEGEVLLERTKSGDLYIAIQKGGDVLVKEFNRLIHEPAVGTELFFPRFGEMKTNSRISNRWKETPEGFAKVDKLPDPVSDKKKSAKSKIKKTDEDLNLEEETDEDYEDADENGDEDRFKLNSGLVESDLTESDPESLEDSLVAENDVENASDSLKNLPLDNFSSPSLATETATFSSKIK